jgi:uncharacterized membrane protein YfcA
MLPADPSTLQVAAGNLIMMIGAVLQASVGFGIALVVVPLLTLMNPSFVPGPMLFASLFLALIMAFRGWGATDKRKLSQALSGLFLGTGIAALGLMIISAEQLPRLFGVLILIAVAISVSGIHFPLTKINLISAGLASGIMGTVAGIHGPPVALLYQRKTGDTVRATLAIFFVIGYSAALLALSLVGRLGLQEIKVGFSLTPGVVGGYLAAGFISPRLDRGPWLRTAVLTIATLSAMVLIFKK